MKKIIYLHFLFFASIGVLSAQQQKSADIIQITKAELFSKDMKQIIAIAYPDKDFGNYTLHGFNLSCNVTENSNNMSFGESTPCSTLTEKQRSLIEKYGEKGMVFTFDGISIMKMGEPGTPYNPAEETFVSIPNISFSIKK